MEGEPSNVESIRVLEDGNYHVAEGMVVQAHVERGNTLEAEQIMLPPSPP